MNFATFNFSAVVTIAKKATSTISKWILLNYGVTNRSIKKPDLSGHSISLYRFAMISVTISDPLAHAATLQAKVCNRSLDGQINYWAKIGKIAEENPDLSFEFIKSILSAREEALEGQVEPYIFD